MTDVNGLPSLKAAVIGVGNIGFHHARIYQQHTATTLSAIVDADATRCKEVADHYQVPGYQSVGEMLTAGIPDICTVSTPTETHVSIAQILIENDIHLLIEKPISRSADQVQSLITKSRSHNLHLGMGLIERFNPVVRTIKKLLSDKLIGRPITIDIKRVGGYPPKIAETGVYFDLGIHDVDIVTFLLDRLPDTMSVQALKIHNNSVEDACTSLLTYPDCTAIIQNNWVSPVKIRSIQITGTRGLLEANLINQQIKHYDHNVDPDKFHHESSFGEFIRRYANPTTQTIDVEQQEPLFNEIDHFIDVVLNDVDYEISTDHMIALTKLLEDHEPV